MSHTTTTLIHQQLKTNPVILYMKGNPDAPQCGFSARAVQILQACGIDFTHVDVLEHPDIRKTLPSVADWPTFPQLFIQSELIGGSDIILSLYQSGELQQTLDNLSHHSQS